MKIGHGITIGNPDQNFLVVIGQSPEMKFLNSISKAASQIYNVGLPRFKAKEFIELFPKFGKIHTIDPVNLSFYSLIAHVNATP